MQKNWYIVYTKPEYEKKLSSLFTKRKIENFCPLNYRTVQSLRRSKIVREPLFKSQVFVNTTPEGIILLKRLGGVISILYWRDEPAIIKQDEIDAIKEFTVNHRNIALGRVPVNMHDIVRIIEDTSYSMEGNILIVKNKALTVSLPSLGYIMMAKMEDGGFFGREVSYKTIRPGIIDKTRQQ